MENPPQSFSVFIGERVKTVFRLAVSIEKAEGHDTVKSYSKEIQPHAAYEGGVF